MLNILTKERVERKGKEEEEEEEEKGGEEVGEE